MHSDLRAMMAHRLLISLALYPAGSGAADFSRCLLDVINCANDQSSHACVSTLNISNTTSFSSLRTSTGHPVITPDTATALSYHGCTKYCGTGQEPFAWSGFSQEYSQWLLPYLALLSQLPFGSLRRVDNLMSMVMTLGSPTLAAYSLYLTLLNARWLNDQLFSGVDFPSPTVRQSVVQVLSGLQQVPLRVHPENSARFESLIVHPDNDIWWTTFAKELDYSHTWSISSATSITWVVIAYLFTVADSLSNVVENIESNGQGTGSVWLWLLPVVVGWLIISPKCDFSRVDDAYHKANRQAFVADNDPTAPSTHVTSDFGLTISPSPDWKLHNRNVTSRDESRIPPVFNYARTLSWSRTVYVISLFYRAAWRKSRRVGVDGKPIPGNTSNDVPRESRLGTHDQIVEYCQPDHHEYPGVGVLWPRGVFFNMLIASLMALQLQWGTTMAAVLATWFTPTIGLGCRSLAYMIYGMVSTAVWLLLLASSVLAYYAHHLTDDPPIPDPESDGGVAPTNGGDDIAIPLRQLQSPNAREVPLDTDQPPNTTTITYPRGRRIRTRFVAMIADALRWLGKSLAVANAIGIIANSIFQFSDVYDNCCCNSSVFAWGLSSAFNVVSPSQNDLDLTKSAWIGALALSLSCCTFFVGSIYLIRDSLPS